MRTVRPRRADPGASLRDIRLLVLDCAGVLTDGRLWFGPRGELIKVFNVRDGHGIHRVLDAGLAVAIISGRNSPATRARARELGIPHVFQGVSDKLARFEKLRRELGLGKLCVLLLLLSRTRAGMDLVLPLSRSG